MPKKHLILIHGRSIKPARKPMRALSKRAILEGLKRAGAGDVAAIFGGRDRGDIKFSFAYYGDVSNDVLRAADHSSAAALEDVGGGEIALPIECLEEDFNFVRQIESFDADTYAQVLEDARDQRWLDELADLGSFLGNAVTSGMLNSLVIRNNRPDLKAYFDKHGIRSEIRSRLGHFLTPALKRGDDICLLAHSMGTIVAYDQLWKYCNMSEYRDLQDTGNKVNMLLTTGCPLAEPGVRRHLIDYELPIEEQYPANIRHWRNLYAEDDYIAHVEELHNAFHGMIDRGLVQTITDENIYNCWSYKDLRERRAHGDNIQRISNPHDFYGYLMNQKTGRAIADWARQ